MEISAYETPPAFTPKLPLTVSSPVLADAPKPRRGRLVKVGDRFGLQNIFGPCRQRFPGRLLTAWDDFSQEYSSWVG